MGVGAGETPSPSSCHLSTLSLSRSPSFPLPSLLCRLPSPSSPRSHSEITPFFKVLEAPDMKPDKVLDVSISQTTLEEVFLLVTAQHQGAE